MRSLFNLSKLKEKPTNDKSVLISRNVNIQDTPKKVMNYIRNESLAEKYAGAARIKSSSQVYAPPAEVQAKPKQNLYQKMKDGYKIKLGRSIGKSVFMASNNDANTKQVASNNRVKEAN